MAWRSQTVLVHDKSERCVKPTPAAQVPETAIQPRREPETEPVVHFDLQPQVMEFDPTQSASSMVLPRQDAWGQGEQGWLLPTQPPQEPEFLPAEQQEAVVVLPMDIDPPSPGPVMTEREFQERTADATIAFAHAIADRRYRDEEQDWLNSRKPPVGPICRLPFPTPTVQPSHESGQGLLSLSLAQQGVQPWAQGLAEPPVNEGLVDDPMDIDDDTYRDYVLGVDSSAVPDEDVDMTDVFTEDVDTTIPVVEHVQPVPVQHQAASVQRRQEGSRAQPPMQLQVVWPSAQPAAQRPLPAGQRPLSEAGPILSSPVGQLHTPAAVQSAQRTVAKEAVGPSRSEQPKQQQQQPKQQPKQQPQQQKQPPRSVPQPTASQPTPERSGVHLARPTAPQPEAPPVVAAQSSQRTPPQPQQQQPQPQQQRQQQPPQLTQQQQQLPQSQQPAVRPAGVLAPRPIPQPSVAESSKTAAERPAAPEPASADKAGKQPEVSRISRLLQEIDESPPRPEINTSQPQQVAPRVQQPPGLTLPDQPLPRQTQAVARPALTLPPQQPPAARQPPTQTPPSTQQPPAQPMPIMSEKKAGKQPVRPLLPPPPSRHPGTESSSQAAGAPTTTRRDPSAPPAQTPEREAGEQPARIPTFAEAIPGPYDQPIRRTPPSGQRRGLPPKPPPTVLLPLRKKKPQPKPPPKPQGSPSQASSSPASSAQGTPDQLRKLAAAVGTATPEQVRQENVPLPAEKPDENKKPVSESVVQTPAEKPDEEMGGAEEQQRPSAVVPTQTRSSAEAPPVFSFFSSPAPSSFQAGSSSFQPPPLPRDSNPFQPGAGFGASSSVAGGLRGPALRQRPNRPVKKSGSNLLPRSDEATFVAEFSDSDEEDDVDDVDDDEEPVFPLPPCTSVPNRKVPSYVRYGPAQMREEVTAMIEWYGPILEGHNRNGPLTRAWCLSARRRMTDEIVEGGRLLTHVEAVNYLDSWMDRVLQDTALVGKDIDRKEVAELFRERLDKGSFGVMR